MPTSELTEKPGAPTAAPTDGPLAVGYYRPTETFRGVAEHAAVMRPDGSLVATTGPSDDPRSLADAQAFAATPRLVAACRLALSLVRGTSPAADEALEKALAAATLRLCPSCELPMLFTVGMEGGRFPGLEVWRCENEDCDAHLVGEELPWDFDFAILDEVIAEPGNPFDGQTVRAVLKFSTGLMASVSDSQAVDEEENTRRVFSPKNRAAERLLHARGLLMVNGCQGCAAGHWG
jgi:hypothetical protein